MLEDPAGWDRVLQMISITNLRLEQILWYQGLQVDPKDVKRNDQGETALPREPFSPENFKSFIEKLEEQKEQQERTERAVAVITRSEDLKRILALPRAAVSEDELEVEDAD